jgi:hypothetical protein
VRPAETLHIGDDPLRDVEAARRIGIARSGSTATACLARRAGAAGIRGADLHALAAGSIGISRVPPSEDGGPPMQFDLLATDGARPPRPADL